MALKTDDAITNENAVLAQLALDINAGSTGQFKVIRTTSFGSKHLAGEDRQSATYETIEVVREVPGKVEKQTIARVYTDDEGNLRSVSIVGGVEFHDVPRFLRSLA